MKKLIIALFLAVGQQGMAQGTVVVKRGQDCPFNQWFVFPGRSHLGVSVFVGTPASVKDEVKRLLEYYGADPEKYVDSDDEYKYEVELQNGYKAFIQVTETDKLNYTRNIYLMVR